VKQRAVRRNPRIRQGLGLERCLRRAAFTGTNRDSASRGCDRPRSTTKLEGLVTLLVSCCGLLEFTTGLDTDQSLREDHVVGVGISCSRHAAAVAASSGYLPGFFSAAGRF
jgi:hypothetical protein